MNKLSKERELDRLDLRLAATFPEFTFLSWFLVLTQFASILKVFS